MFKMGWFDKNKRAVGLDIGSFSVKVAELESGQSGLQLRNYGFSNLPVNTSRESLISAIRQALEKADVKSNRVNLGLSGPQVVVRYIDFPKMTRQELVNAIRFEAEQYMPFKKEEVFLDSSPFLSAGRSDNTMSVLLVAARKELVLEKIEIIKEAGLTAGVIDVNSFCLMNCFETYGMPVDDDVFALIELGASTIIVNIMKGRIPYFTREIPIAGRALSETITREKNMSFAEAEEWKMGSKGEEIIELIRPVVMEIVGEIRLCFDHYENQTEQVVNSIYLSGGSSVLSGLAEFLSAQLGIQVKLWNPLVNLKIGTQVRNPERLNLIAHQLAIAIGLALRNV